MSRAIQYDELLVAMKRLADCEDECHCGAGGPWQDLAQTVLFGKPIPEDSDDAHFPGGEKALMEFIESNRDQTIRIPDSLNHNNDIFLTLHVALAIDEQGKITNVNHPVYGGDVHFTDEIDSLVKKMPDWIPAYITDTKTQKRNTIKSNAGFDINYYFEGKSQQQGK